MHIFHITVCTWCTWCDCLSNTSGWRVFTPLRESLLLVAIHVGTGCYMAPFNCAVCINLFYIEGVFIPGFMTLRPRTTWHLATVPFPEPATLFHFVDLLTWKLPLTSDSMEVNFLPRKISMEMGASRFTSMQASGSFHGNSTVGGSGSFHCFHQLQPPPISSMEGSTSFHIPLHTSTYFHQYHEPPAASTRVP